MVNHPNRPKKRAINETGYPPTPGLQQAAEKAAKALGLPSTPQRKHAWAKGHPICLICGAPKSEDAPPFCENDD